MFSKKIKDNEAVLFVFNKESLISTIVNGLFVFYPIKVIWLDSNLKIVDIKILKPFTLFLSPKKPAKYVLELSPKALKDVKINDKLNLK